MSGSALRSPLARFRVLDLTRVRAGPNAVKQLSDWGASVIKVEGPGEGVAPDRLRFLEAAIDTAMHDRELVEE